MNDSSLPEGWIDTTFGEVALVVSGGTPRAAQSDNFAPVGSGVPWITPADLSKYTKKYISRGARDLSEEGYLSCSARLMPAGTVLLSSRAPIGYVAIAEQPVSTNQGFKSFVLPEGIDSTYIFYYLKHKRDLAESLGTGTTFKELSLSATKSLPLRLAPYETQVAIGSMLDTVFGRLQIIRERLDDARSTVRQLRASILAAAIRGELTEEWRDRAASQGPTAADAVASLRSERLEAAISEAERKRIEMIYASSCSSLDFDIPNSWSTTNLEKLATTFEYGSSAKSQKRGTIPVLRMGNIQDGELDWDDLVYTSNQKEIEKYQLHSGDVLFNRTNSPALVGKSAIFRGEREAIFAGYLIRVRTASALDPEYLAICLNSFHGREYSWRVKIDGVSQSNINASKLKQFPVPLPSLAEQSEIVKKVSGLLARAVTIEQSIARVIQTVGELEPRILDQAFTGKLVSPLPFVESARSIVARASRDLQEGNGTVLEKKQSRGRTNVASKKSSHPVSIPDVLRRHKNHLTTFELLIAAGYPSDADVATVEEFFLAIRDNVRSGAIRRERLGNEDYFFASEDSKEAE